jgi:hypothetical protein
MHIATIRYFYKFNKVLGLQVSLMGIDEKANRVLSIDQKRTKRNVLVNPSKFTTANR